VQTDLNNCGACGVVCPTSPNGTASCTGGKCGLVCNAGFQLCAGACISSVVCCGMSGETCGSLTPGCNGNGSCVCFQTAEGGSLCAQPTTCGQSCASTSNCPSGYVCLVNTCCGGGECHSLALTCAGSPNAAVHSAPLVPAPLPPGRSEVSRG
jgi:hypothetical protein